MEFEALLESQRPAVERFVRFRLPIQADAEDVLQEIYLSAYQSFPKLKDTEAFRPWLIRIARNKCNDYFRRKGAALEIPLEELAEKELVDSRYGPNETSTVRETVERLGDKDKQILYLYFWKELPQAEIAKQLHIPLGTVKSRLHTAKHHFKDSYPYAARTSKGESDMKKMPEFLPAYTIEESPLAPFPVKWEELMGWFLVPRLGEKLSWAHCMMVLPESVTTCITWPSPEKQKSMASRAWN